MKIEGHFSFFTPLAINKKKERIKTRPLLQIRANQSFI